MLRASVPGAAQVWWWETFTCTNYQSFGSTAVHAVQQRLWLNVDVQESHGASHLGQPEPHAQEVGLVAHEQGNAFPFPQLHVLQEHMCQSVASPLDVPVGVHAPLVNDKRLVRHALRLLDEPVQHRVHAGSQFKQLQIHPVSHHPEQKHKVPPEVWEAEFLQHMNREKSRDQSWEPCQRRRHVCGCGTDRGPGGDLLMEPGYTRVIYTHNVSVM